MALEAVGSTPTIHPINHKAIRCFMIPIMGCSQAVRQRTLTPSFRWFESIQPSHFVPKPFRAFDIGVSPSGKAPDSGSGIPRVQILPPQPFRALQFCRARIFLFCIVIVIDASPAHPGPNHCFHPFPVGIINDVRRVAFNLRLVLCTGVSREIRSHRR